MESEKTTRFVDINYDIDKNEIFIQNATQTSLRLQFWLVDLNTNLTVQGWWMIFDPGSAQKWGVDNYYYLVKNPGGFKIIYTEIGSNEIIGEKEFKLKGFDNSFQFNIKAFSDINYGSWHVLVNDRDVIFKFKTSDIVYDLGGNVGIFTKFALMHNVKKVYTFEPDPSVAECIRKTFANNKNVVVVEKALFDEEKIVKFPISPMSVANSFYLSSDKSIDVQCVNLEKYATENRFKLPTVIKSDIEGSEFTVLKYTTDKFLENVRIFILEYHYEGIFNYSHLSEIIQRFMNLGYKASKSKITDLYSSNSIYGGTLLFEKD